MVGVLANTKLIAINVSLAQMIADIDQVIAQKVCVQDMKRHANVLMKDGDTIAVSVTADIVWLLAI